MNWIIEFIVGAFITAIEVIWYAIQLCAVLFIISCILACFKYIIDLAL